MYKDNMIKRLRKKQGLSPIVTTVLLVALTIGIISIIFFWFRGMVQEGVVKFGENIELVCNDVSFEVSYSSGTLNIVNNGNVPIFLVNVRITTGGSYETKSIEEFEIGSNWPTNGLSQGGTFSGRIENEVGDAEELTIFPILIGTSTSGDQKTYICEGEYGKQIEI
jgi:FlaG/FlaF family flagellin (archaellin)